MLEPLILTLRMDDLSQQDFDRLREEHFPRARNFIPAHLTLFHKLPGDREREVSQGLRDLCRQQGPFSLTANGLISMGRGVGYRLESPALLHLMNNHRPGSGDPAALLEVVDAYLRLNPQDAEVLEARERLMGEGRPVGA